MRREKMAICPWCQGSGGFYRCGAKVWNQNEREPESDIEPFGCEHCEGTGLVPLAQAEVR
jgi:hypothetical protein